MPLDTDTHKAHVRAVTARHMDVDQIVVYRNGVLQPIKHFYKTIGKTLVIELQGER